MSERLFEQALGIDAPWFVGHVQFEAAARKLVIVVDFKPGSRFAVADTPGTHPVHDTVTKTYRHLNFFEHECHLQVRTPRVKLPEGNVVLASPPFAGRLSGFTLLFEALIVALAGQMPFAAVARIVGESAHRVRAVCERYVELACAQEDLSQVKALAIDETSRARGHSYITLAADTEARRVVFVTEGRDAQTIERLAQYLKEHKGDAQAVHSVSIDMSAAFIKGVGAHLPQARVTFDKFHVVAHANKAVDQTRRSEQRADASLKGMRWALLKDRRQLSEQAAEYVDALAARCAVSRTARAWHYKEQLRAILDCKQVNAMRDMLSYWCTCVMRSKVSAMREVAAMVRKHLEGIVAWASTRQTNGFLEAINGLFQAAKRRARGFKRLSTIKTVIFLIAGKLNFQAINPHAS